MSGLNGIRKYLKKIPTLFHQKYKKAIDQVAIYANQMSDDHR